MKLVVGLGNIGSQYARTRHNIGFMVVDRLAEQLGATWKLEAKMKAELAVTELDGEKLILVKPQTMMNLSGEAVQRLAQFYKIAPGDVWVLHDDLDVEFGKLRLRVGGSSGQNGVRSVAQHIGAGFVRARLGISLNDRSRESSEEYVLRPFNSEERTELPHLVETATDAIRQQILRTEPTESTFDLLG
jgi:PTH1 family peptidyl-tRNA hydrolase